MNEKEKEYEKIRTIRMIRKLIYELAWCVILIALICYFWNNPVPSEYHYLVTH